MWKTRGWVSAVALTMAVGCGTSGEDPNMANPNAMADSEAPGSDLARTSATADEGRADDFIREAMAGGQAEVTLAEMAQEKASSPAVKQLAQRIHQDHEEANRELMRIAQERGITPPAEMTGKAEDAYEDLSGQAGAEFDRRYAERMVEMHQDTIDDFEAAATHTQGELQAFIDRTLPVLRQHLQMAQAQQRQLTER